jgi:uncharacterized protein YjbI with pentapeptide repeats
MADPRALLLVQEDKPQDFNRLIEPLNGQVDLSGGMFRGYDLRKFNLQRANLTDCYFRNADLRGLDLENAKLHGASLKDAKVSGVLFPLDIPADEIRLSLDHGTRLREPGPV